MNGSEKKVVSSFSSVSICIRMFLMQAVKTPVALSQGYHTAVTRSCCPFYRIRIGTSKDRYSLGNPTGMPKPKEKKTRKQKRNAR